MKHPSSNISAWNTSTRLIYHQLGFHLAHRRVEVVLDDLPNVGGNLGLELFHEFGAVVVHISGIGEEEMSEHTNKILQENMANRKKDTIKRMRQKKFFLEKMG